MYIMGGVIGQSVGLDYNFGQGIGFAHTFFQLRPKEIAVISCRAQQNGISRCWRRLGKQVQQIVRCSNLFLIFAKEGFYKNYQL